ncbi:hypothetical protein KC332_g878 [Hortaea werneckii]|uniref:Uncharacterized protein n=1 Tax=Hortaea werneckii TaxID=91943 RepID=A0A3M7JA50_HORWE|nr:hypothetical protein KC358_g2223 [Hortaea werneckii]KAI6851945.1 hypothetical protein KC350_g1355 [Hortaea werneckii]KAI6943117.1 hypothetical protein KC341_g1698 [Hortaea werneckii]KAI6948931.1 hypothetical protein KC348_g1660 [Hortaea werneckii]KAI6982344.1 hypothetical protein KC321_g703 [Hortaea werneckii]
MADDASISTLPQAERVERPLHLIPVGLKEAALDSPTFRATALHFTDQIEIVERWLEGYVKAASKLVAEVSSLESLVNSLLSQSMPPVQVSEAVLDHDYTMLAMQRYGEGAREFWQSTLRGVKRSDSTVIDPIKHFLSTELRAFKESRNALQATQKSFDHVIARYLSQSKTKEASSLREDAFQVHEARRAYIKASMDFCTGAPQVRASLDKLIVRIFSDQWKDMRASREANNGIFAKLSSEMERVRGWSSEMDNSERAFKRELLTARRQIEDSVSSRIRPSRELEDYSASTVPYLGSGAGGATGITSKSANERLEQQGWLFMKTTTGKPARTVWSRRWVFVKSGIFGWLIQGAKSGGVEESEKIGVLLCSIRPAFQEDRRFCFEIKTKDTSIILQAETQDELTEWISALEVAKKKALEDPTSTETSPLSSGVDPAFAVSSPVAPEFAAKLGDSQPDEARESEASVGMSSLASRSSFDTAAPPPLSTNRRVMSLEKQEGEGTREHAARIMSRFDLYKRGGASPRVPSEASTGGIASLISASHNILPVGPGAPPSSQGSDSIHPPKRSNTIPTSSLAPSTLANPPAPTNLSHTAVIVSGERGVGIGRAAEGMPSGIMANLWGSSNWGYVNRLGEDVARRQLSSSRNASSGVEGNSRSPSVSRDDSSIMDGTGTVQSPAAPELPKHRKTLSAANDTTSLSAMKLGDDSEDFPNYYPLPLKVQQAQFRMLFPSVPRSEQVVLVFRATWNANEQQEFPGRVYVTTQEVYFYSNHLGLVLITGASLSSINEVTSAPGRDCDFLFLLLKENREDTDQRRITIKVFLEPLRLLQRRLSYLVRNANSEDPDSLEEVLKVLIKLEADVPQRSSSVESWEDITYEGGSPTTAGDQQKSPRRYGKNVKASLRIDGNLYGDPARTGREVQKFKLPAQPVVYAPQGMQASVTRDFNVSAKALFHVMFGDKSAVFQLLYANRWADKISQSPWSKPAEAKGPWTRKFTSQDQDSPMSDTQTVDVSNDHLCYVVTNNKNPWRLPYATRFGLVTKIVITHTSKSKCKLAIFQQVNWLQAPQWSYIKHLIEKQALNSLEADALDLTNVAMDQVAKLGNHSKTNRAIEIFGGIGQQLQVPQIDVSAVPNVARSIAANGARPQETTGLPRLVLDDVFAKTLQLVSMVIDILIAVGKGAVGVCTAHTFLVALLATSMIYNSWYGYRDSLLWYQERSAGKFMSRVGVTPDPVMGRSIYLRDLEELVMPADVNETLDAMAPSSSMAEAKTCRTTFSDMIAADDASIATPQKHAARLHNTRDAIARYRHDLLIALRVVNRVENDVLKAEWEDWVRSEERKCAKVERMLQRGESGKKSSKSKLDVDAQLGEEFAEYCRSCRTEVAGLLNETRIM